MPEEGGSEEREADAGEGPAGGGGTDAGVAARAACGAGVALLGATAGSTLRCPVPRAEARVSAEGACRGRTGATRGPRARWTDGPCQEPAVPPGSLSP
ncbi:hypothetical protein [Streptomyces sp. NPDC002913]